MKQINVKLRKGWIKTPSDEISDWTAPIGAIAWGARPEKNSAAYFNIYVYKALGGTALEECVNCSEIVSAGHPNECSFAGYNAAYVYKDYCMGAIVAMYFFVEVENFMVAIMSAGTEQQAVQNIKWIEKHFELGDEIPDNNGNPREDGVPLVPPAMLAQQVDFTMRDYEMTRMAVPQLPSHFDFIVEASTVAASDEDELVARVNDDYSRHFGYREIDYDILSKTAEAELPEDSDYYIGIGKKDVSPWGKTVRLVLFVGFGEDPVVKQVGIENIADEISRLVIDQDIELQY